MYENDPVLKKCMSFCFFSLIIKDLNAIKNDQNVHLISRSRYQDHRGRLDRPTYYRDMYATIDSTLADVSQEFQEFAREVLRGTKIIFPCNDKAML